MFLKPNSRCVARANAAGSSRELEAQRLSLFSARNRLFLRRWTHCGIRRAMAAEFVTGMSASLIGLGALCFIVAQNKKKYVSNFNDFFKEIFLNLKRAIIFFIYAIVASVVHLILKFFGLFCNFRIFYFYFLIFSSFYFLDC